MWSSPWVSTWRWGWDSGQDWASDFSQFKWDGKGLVFLKRCSKEPKVMTKAISGALGVPYPYRSRSACTVCGHSQLFVYAWHMANIHYFL